MRVETNRCRSAEKRRSMRAKPKKQKQKQTERRHANKSRKQNRKTLSNRRKPATHIHTHTHTRKNKNNKTISWEPGRTYWSVNATPSKVCQLHNSLLCLELPNQKHVQTSNETRETLHSAQVAPIPAARRRSIASHVGLLWVWMKSNA